MENETNIYVQEQIEFENTENEIQDDEYIYENIVMDNNEYENSENKEPTNEIMQENIVLENTSSIDLQSEKLDRIHEDLGVICSFLIIFALVIVFRYIYKFFDIFF